MPIKGMQHIPTECERRIIYAMPSKRQANIAGCRNTSLSHWKKRLSITQNRAFEIPLLRLTRPPCNDRPPTFSSKPGWYENTRTSCSDRFLWFARARYNSSATWTRRTSYLTSSRNKFAWKWICNVWRRNDIFFRTKKHYLWVCSFSRHVSQRRRTGIVFFSRYKSKELG